MNAYDLDFTIYDNLVRIETIADGNCFFHSVLGATNPEYKKADNEERKKIAKDFRWSLCDILEKEYSNLSRGNLEEFSKNVPDYTLKNLKKLLKSNQPVDNIFIELISNYIGINIILIHNNKRYITGQDDDILIHNRKSIVILVSPGHYEFVGVKKTDNIVRTVFDFDDPFIQAILK